MSAVPITYDMDLFRGVKHRYYDSDSSHYAGIKANGTTTSSVDYTLPPAPPAANDYVLACSTAGVMNWTGSNTPANPGASVGLSAVNGTATTYMRSDAAPALSQSITPDWTGFHSHRFDSMGTTPDDAKGILLYNTTAAAAGAQQISPAIRWRGQGWKTNSTAASQQVSFRAYVLPVQGTANPSATWILQASINEGSYTDVMTVSSAGIAFVSQLLATSCSVTSLAVSSNVTVAGSVGVSSMAYTDAAGGLQGFSNVRGSIIVGSSANWSKLAIGSARQVFTSDGTDASWATPLGSDDGSGTGTCTTTDATTPTTLYAFSPTDGTSVAVVAHIGNKKDDESASEAFIYLATVRRSGGTVSVDYTTAASIGGGFSVLREFNVSGTTVRIQVKGAAGTTIQWKATVFCTVIS